MRDVTNPLIYTAEATYSKMIYDELYRHASFYEKKYLEKYQLFRQKYDSLLGIFLLKMIQKDELDSSYPITHTDRGKPYFVGYSGEISISHSDGTVAVGLSSGKLGIDIESKLVDIDGSLFLSEHEQIIIQQQKDRDLLTELWVLKESYVKALGCGFLLDPTTISFYMIDNEWHVNGSDFSFSLTTLPNEKILSICKELKTDDRVVAIDEEELLDWIVGTRYRF
ncbi:4'-phosphopantetheinyl transferase family protein [Metabacillus litoralis]|uniref:4'-phosphopantetheinyl transferase family protein n=1 Tax=Metabacillus litoralis TaxID=152268 RepID=UPI00203B1544|nr:4'-phosphopantetheinyl transferase superfamily protein [Metabacillus litoralis]MCM3412351.1 4'-phosphopantetheinyl transferase superfamily protein [Metabacillus litoralis]